MEIMDLIERYKKLISVCPGMEVKGKNNLYTSANGHMFSQINKAGQLGLRFSAERQKQYFEKFNTGPFYSYGATMRGYILVSDQMLQQDQLMMELLKESESYVKNLDPK